MTTPIGAIVVDDVSSGGEFNVDIQTTETQLTPDWSDHSFDAGGDVSVTPDEASSELAVKKGKYKATVQLGLEGVAGETARNVRFYLKWNGTKQQGVAHARLTASQFVQVTFVALIEATLADKDVELFAVASGGTHNVRVHDAMILLERVD